ncbi:MAG: GFA family protein [Gammaproteobacteria bacterium]|nr:GFA family protein [Gammaproteobacteria bacterium]
MVLEGTTSVLGPRTLMAFDGRCLVGQIHYRLTRRFLNAVHCYCSMCRRAHGTGFSTHVVCRPDQLKIVTGTLIDYESSPSAFRSFCPCCGSHILIQGQSGDGNLAIPAGTLDGLPDLTILAHIFVAEKVDWCQINDGLPQHQGWSPGYGATA